MSLSDELAKLVVEVTSPDGNIKAKLVAGEQLTVAFRPGTYARYDERGLEHQLSRLAMLAWTGYRRGFFEAKGRAEDISAKDAEKEHLNHWDANTRRYNEEMAQIVARGKSSGNVIRAQAKGLAFWKVEIRDGTLASMDEATFCAECVSVLAAVQRDSKNQEILLKDFYFGLNIPKSWRKKNPLRIERGVMD
ncbi:hypothetical protein [Stackebrandtia nassauensis]|uniref:Uncharacterized protein n=1 Tax=Stackebrandtia nassauensis (strain DSM 44728 / CIP 108903 / NRRL B-16338 / NBRC 102104 / LLR-40K-21) TaxID=446470 RepID=D3Q1Y3_STANL|nr:hypothetical protein [Stackebrandtia nassauensis]ADD41850.1 hypothetical protein Snas_2157 [Stackebrandtia nassauensis DSM 44728]